MDLELLFVSLGDVKIVDKNDGFWDFAVNLFFENGYGASIVKSRSTYGGDIGLYELAVITGNEEVWELCYTTEITGDVIGYLSEEDVMILLHRIKNLKE